MQHAKVQFRTPRRLRRVPVSSPYFSPSKHSRQYLPLSSDEECLSNPDSESESGSDADLLQDPLFCFYFRNFLLAYRRLACLKPILIQESVAHDPWKLLIAVTLLNKTTGKLAIPVFKTIIAKWPTPWALSHANLTELVAILKPLGTHNIRSSRLIKLSELYLRDPPYVPDLRPSTPRLPSSDTLAHDSSSKRTRYPPTPISHLPGAGQYALDSYRIFCTVHHPSTSDEWKVVMPSDKELIRYLRWKWAFVERKEWIPGLGVIRSASLAYLNNLIAVLERGPS
ncbi:Methyl-CpG-binding domain protein 4 [Termitomyces sp. T112]|nr:Methyl-CpG-binding domain protein 4 [Termitomyces sp. T112]KNZ71853.1 Methyl-CpG-binding domain protein 4 [Termitomyces sp. J132]